MTSKTVNTGAMRRGTALLLGVALLLGACRGSEDESGDGADKTTAPNGDATTTSAAGEGAPGDFGDLQEVCGPGDAKGETARGVSDTTIQIATMADPGNTILPGLEQEFFDVADAFAKWCNEAGGILGRKIEVHKRDAKLFETGARFTEACQTDFMSVGGGNGLDDASVEPRLGCDLGQIAAYQTSPKAIESGLQVQPTPNPLDTYPIGGIAAVAKQFPEAGQHFGLLGREDVNGLATLNRARDAATQAGLTVVNTGTHPAIAVDNWRPYVEEWRGKGVELFTPLTWPDLASIVQAMSDVGWAPTAMSLTTLNYTENTLEAAKAGDMPPSWVILNFWPFELAEDNPAMVQMMDMVGGVAPDTTWSLFHVSATNAWLLWAVSAKACGSDLTVECVLAEAEKQSSWTGGGLLPAVDLSADDPQPHDCFVAMEVTADGFVYDEEVTQPNESIYNCDPENTAHLTSDYTEGG